MKYRRVGARRAANPSYSIYHPRWHRKPIPIFWWLARLPYAKFITRELTSLAVAYAAVLLVLQVWTLSRGEEAHARLVNLLRTPPLLVVNGLALLMLLFHTVTWLNLAPKALVLRLGKRRVPDAAVLAGHYLTWLGATAVVVWYLLGV